MSQELRVGLEFESTIGKTSGNSKMKKSPASKLSQPNSVMSHSQSDVAALATPVTSSVPGVFQVPTFAVLASLGVKALFVLASAVCAKTSNIFK